MILRGRRLTALLLALCLLLGLAACGDGGKEKDGDSTLLSGTVYVPAYLELGTELSYVDSGCSDGKNMYILGSIHSEREETDPETGETYTAYDSRYAIVRLPLDGGAAVELENFQSAPSSEENGYTSLSNLRLGAEGTIWVTESSSRFDPPEGFDPETDDFSLYQTYTETQRQLDSTGNEIARIDTSSLTEKTEIDYVNTVIFDKEGDIYAAGNGKIAVLSPSMEVKFVIEEESLWGDGMIQLSDGTVGTRISYNDPVTETYGYKLKVIDKTAKGWGKEYDLPTNAYEVYPGGGEYLFYYKNNDSLYGFHSETGEGVKLLNWLDSNINANEIEFFTFLEDGRVAVMTQSYRRQGGNQTLAVLTPTDRSTLPEKTTLVYATLGLGYDTRNDIIDFNKASDKYFIEVRDYSEFNTAEDYSAGLTKLNTEIIAGNIPDILDTNQLPLRQYGAKGFLEDLWPYIEQDTEIGGRAGLMDRVFTAAEQDGKLYQVFDTFSIQTVMGSPEIVGTNLSWTLADLQAALAKMPEGCTIFGEGDTKSGMLSQVLGMNLNSFVDWNTGECHFEGGAFKALLEFCNSFPAEFDYDSVSMEDYEGEPTRISTGKQMLLGYNLSGFEDIQMYKAFFGGDVTFVGYPKEDGSTGSSFSTYSGMAMSSTCQDKEGAWSFIRTLLLPEYSTEDEEEFYGMMGNFPTNRSDFDFFVKQAMTPDGYETDENGNQVLDENGNPIEVSHSGWSWDGFDIEVMATTQDEYDQIMELYNAVDTLYSYDTSIYKIVDEVAGSYFSGDRTLDDTVSQIQSRVKLYVNESR